ncbi:hypothetical protein RU639_005608 [Aspergillus parasiticus]
MVALFAEGNRPIRRRIGTDLRWAYISGGQSADIAVLEMKAPFVLRWDDFNEAMATEDDAKKKHDRAHKFGDHTLLKDNAIVLSKQTKKYATSLGVADVAIFDWSSMFVFDYSDVDSYECGLVG